MHNDDGYFDERVAARYDEDSAEMFDPAVLGPVRSSSGFRRVSPSAPST